MPYTGKDGGKLHKDISSDWWYRLSDKVAVRSEDVDKLSSFNLYIQALDDNAIMTLSGQEAFNLHSGFVHITQVDNYRSKPNVKSALMLDNTRKRPFDLVSFKDEAHDKGRSWNMTNCYFEVGGKAV